jgi:photosystem II stability/assembly factor-like uncharacterized protein
MRSLRRAISFSFAIILFTSQAFAQWEWAGGASYASYGGVCSAAGRLIVWGYYTGWPVLVSPDRGRTWITSPVTFGGPHHDAVAWTSGSDTVIFSREAVISRSTDFGLTWARSDSGVGRSDVSSLAFSKASSSRPKGILLAGTVQGGVFISTDGGAFWASADSGLSTLMVNSVATVDTILFAATAGGGIFRSLDNGVSWGVANNGLGDTAFSYMVSAGNEVFAAAGARVFRSSDAGGSWMPLDSNALPSTILSLKVIPSPEGGIGRSVIANCDSGLFRSSESQPAWMRLTLPPNTDLNRTDNRYNLTAIGNDLFSLRVSSIVKSADAGSTWSLVGQRAIGQIWSVKTAPGDTSLTTYCLTGNDLLATTNHGSSWTPIFSVNGPKKLASAATRYTGANPSVLRWTLGGGDTSGTAYRSTDGGKNWTTMQTIHGLAAWSFVDLDSTLLIAGYPPVIYNGSFDSRQGIYRSTDDGLSWVRPEWSSLGDSVIWYLQSFQFSSGDDAVFASNGLSIYRSSDHGKSWQGNLSGLKGTGWKRFAAIEDDLYLSIGGTVNVVFNEDGSTITTYDSAHVFYSKDKGLTWANVTGDLHPTFIGGIAAARLPGHPGRTFLAACLNNAVYTSTEGGLHWEKASAGLPYTFSANLMTADQDYLYLNLPGVFRLPWSQVTVTSVKNTPAALPVAFSLSQNYPNPFNPTTTIRYQVPGISDVKLTVYDILGREVSVLVNERQTPGTYQVKFDGSNLASGVYLYRLMAGSFVQTRKLLLLR